MPKDGAPTRERILDAAERLVIEQGYSATSLDHVIGASGTSKGAFFHHFDSKRALADALVERYVAADVAVLETALAAATAAADDAAGRAVAFLAHFEALGEQMLAEQSGCLYASVLVERQLVADGISGGIAGAVRAWREGYAALLRDALPEDSEVDADALADHVFVTFEGTFLLARTTQDPTSMRAQLRVLRQLVERLLDRAQPSRV